ncbi:cold shock domain-containing protein [Curvibacter gracilis]|uniref:cold shock domain-containing protein n=1 Tax=Curvibacter gracilis TaxID=230310 RepID=UPI000A03398E
MFDLPLKGCVGYYVRSTATNSPFVAIPAYRSNWVLNGKLRCWNDERGFGLIAPRNGGREIFVHISSFPREGSRPNFGETVMYELSRGNDGKAQAGMSTGGPSENHQHIRAHCYRIATEPVRLQPYSSLH